MADRAPFRGDEARAKRRDAARRRRLRGRLVAVGLLAIGVLAVVLLATDDSGSKRERAARAAATQPAGRHQPAQPPAQSHVGWRPHKGPVPILTYHVIDHLAPGAPYPELFVEPSAFSDQVAWLKQHGFEGVTLDQVQSAWYGSGKLPPHPIVLSFDDGYLGQYTHALPTLRRVGWPGVLDLKQQGSDLSHKEVQKMIDAGWELASHTITHPDLTTLGAAQLKVEVAHSRALLRREFHVPVHNFCYPSGRYNAVVIAAVKAAGYRGATSTDPGLASRDEPYALKRIHIDRTDGASGLAAKLKAVGL